MSKDWYEGLELEQFRARMTELLDRINARTLGIGYEEYENTKEDEVEQLGQAIASMGRRGSWE